MRPSNPSSTPPTMIEPTASSHWPEMAKRTADRPKHSASTVTAFGASARSGMPRRGRSRKRAFRGGMIGPLPGSSPPASLGDAFDQLVAAGDGQHRLAGDGALAEQHLRRGARRQIHVHPAAEADQADALAPGDAV